MTEGGVAKRIPDRSRIVRGVLFATGVLLLLAVTVRLVWLRSAAVAAGYEIVELREREAEIENRNAELRTRIADKRRVRVLIEAAQRLGLKLESEPGASWPPAPPLEGAE